MARTTVTTDKLTLKIMMMFDRILKILTCPLYTRPKTNYSTTRVIHYPRHRSTETNNENWRTGDYGTHLLWQINDVSGLKSRSWNMALFRWKMGLFAILVIHSVDYDYFKSTKHRGIIY